jgi:hypothetical protein
LFAAADEREARSDAYGSGFENSSRCSRHKRHL